MHAPDRQLALERVGLDEADARELLTLLEIFDLDDAPLLGFVAERLDELLLVVCDARRRCLGELELAEGVLELLAHARQRLVRVRRDRRADVLDGEPDRPRLQRRQLRSAAEDVAVELLVDADASRPFVELA